METNRQDEKREQQIKKCLDKVETILRGDIRYGTVTVVVQDGVPIQIDKLEKQRFQ